MRMEYLHEGSPDCPLIRLYDFDSVEIERLCDLFRSLSAGDSCGAGLHEQPYIEAVGECRLTLRVGNRDQRIVPSGRSCFEWILTAAGWEWVWELASSFADQGCSAKPGGNYYWQWLNRDGNVSLLLSQTGQW